jgi:hypothetical protein
MDDQALEVLEACAKGAIGDPLKEIVVEYAGGSLTQLSRIAEDHLRAFQIKNLVRLRDGLAKFAVGRRFVRPLSTKLLLTCLSAAAIEDSDMLRDCFAALIANAGTSTDDDERYQIFADTLSRLPARQAAALRDAYIGWTVEHGYAEAEHKRRGSFEEFVSFIPVEGFFPAEGRDLTIANLERLGLIKLFQETDIPTMSFYYFTDLAFDFVATCMPLEP